VRRRLALVAIVVTAVGPAGPGCVPAPSAEEAAWETVALEDLQVLAPGARFTAVRELVLSGPSLWVLDGSPPFVTRVTLEGGEVIAFGARGPGPGELMDPRSLLPSPGAPEGSVWVWDYGTGRVSRFDSVGAFLEAEPMDEGGATRVRRDLEEVSYVEPFRVRSLGLDEILREPVEPGTYVPPAKRMGELINKHSSSSAPARTLKRPTKRPAATR